MTDQRRLDTPAITVDGRPLSADCYPRLRLLRVEESVQLPDRLTLRFEDAHFEMFDSFTFSLGSMVEVAIRSDSAPIVLTEVEVTAVAIEQGASGHELVITGLDRWHRLARIIRHRTFRQMSDASIARQIASEYGLDAEVSAPSTTHDQIFQAGQTDADFLRQRAALVGLDVWVTGRTLHLAPHPTSRATPPALIWGSNLTRFGVRYSAVDRCDEVVVNGWDAVGKRSVSGRAATPQASIDASFVHRMSDDARRSFGDEQRTTGRRGTGTRVDADALAASLIGRASSAAVVLHGETHGDPRLAAGTEVRIEAVGSALTGRYRLTGVEHVIGEAAAYSTRFTCGSNDPGSLVDLVRPHPTLSGLTASAGSALVVGQVTNNDDPDGLARVKVSYPNLSSQDESLWAPVLAAGGGASRGLELLPEVGDQVLVGFEFADLHRPVVLGGLWNRTDKPPEAHPGTSGRTDQRVLASRRNHRLELVDDPTGRIRLGMGDCASEVVLKKKESTFHGDQKVVISAGEIEISATSKVTITAPQVEISADSALTQRGHPIRLN